MSQYTAVQSDSSID